MIRNNHPRDATWPPSERCQICELALSRACKCKQVGYATFDPDNLLLMCLMRTLAQVNAIHTQLYIIREYLLFDETRTDKKYITYSPPVGTCLINPRYQMTLTYKQCIRIFSHHVILPINIISYR